MSAPEARDGVQSVHRALDILELVTASGPVGVTEIGRRTGLKPSTAHGLIRTLAIRGYLARAGQDYRIGPAAIGLATEWGRSAELVPHVEPILAELSAQRLVAATATVLIGREARIVASTPSPGPISLRIEYDAWKDPLELATGQALIALGEQSRWEEFISRSEVSPRLYPSWSQCLSQIRAHRVAFKLSRDPRALVSMAMPVLGRGGEAVCAIGVFAPGYLAGDVMSHETFEALWSAGARASQQFGGDLDRPLEPDFSALRRHLPAEHLSTVVRPRSALGEEELSHG